jgi:1-acyl-sn-glycerol-3-phosphate acyltransferase
MIDFLIRCILFPIKFVLFLVAHIILLFPKKYFNTFLPYCLQIILWCIGFKIQNITDKRRNKVDTPIIVYQHSTFADHYILLSIFSIVRFVVFDKHCGNPIVKKFTDNFGCIRVTENVKTGATKKIQEFIDASDYTHKIAISPEGGRRLDIDEQLSRFSTGAFVPRAPVQPVLISFEYENEFEDPTWNSIYNYNDNEIISWYLWRLFAPCCNINIILLEESIVEPEESPIDYSIRVRNNMLSEIKNPR